MSENWLKIGHKGTVKKLTPSEVAERAGKVIQVFEANRKKVALYFLAIWFTFIFVVFSVLVTIRFAFWIF
ncbi:MAG: hypothetical protein ACOCWW_00180 [Bacteroidota bacterium]